MRSGEVALALLAVAASGCRPAKEPAETRLPPIVVTPDGRESLAEGFERADRAFETGDYSGSETLYDELGARARGREDKARALFGAATSADKNAAPERAYSAYLATLSASEATVRAPGATGETVSKGRVVARAVRLAFFLDRTDERELAALERLLSSLPSERLPLLDEMALSAFRAARALARGDEASANAALARGDYFASELRLELLPKLPLEAAPHFLVRGDVLRASAKKLVFVPLPTDFAAVLEERCALLLRAQSSYSDVMRAESAEYSARAGERIADLYESLHRDLVTMERPKSADTDERRELLDAALRLRYGILLEKAEKMMAHTIEMIERTGLGAETRARAEGVVERLRGARKDEESALGRLPFPREELEGLLREMERDAEKPR